MQTPLDYEPGRAGKRANGTAKMVASLMVGAAVVAVNGMLLSAAYSDRSWEALRIAIEVGPLTNAAIAAVALACIPAVRRLDGGTPVGTYGLRAVILPLAAILLDGVVVFSMDLHCC